MNVYLGSKDLNKTNLAYTDISGFSLFDSDLRNSKLNNVEINSCNLNYADLSNVEWTKVICKEKPLLKGHENKVQEVQFSPDGSFIVYIEENGKKIKLWDANKYLFINDLEGHADYVNQLHFHQTLQFGYHEVMIALIQDGILRILNQLLVKFKRKQIIKFLTVRISQDEKNSLQQSKP